MESTKVISLECYFLHALTMVAFVADFFVRSFLSDYSSSSIRLAKLCAYNRRSIYDELHVAGLAVLPPSFCSLAVQCPVDYLIEDICESWLTMERHIC